MDLVKDRVGLFTTFQSHFYWSVNMCRVVFVTLNEDTCSSRELIPLNLWVAEQNMRGMRRLNLRCHSDRQIMMSPFKKTGDKCWMHTGYSWGAWVFQNLRHPHKNSRRQKGDRKQVSYERSPNNRHHGAQISDPGDLALEICATLG
jgi:hypothetical protein